MNLYKKIFIKLLVVLISVVFFRNFSFAQISTQQLGGSDINTITTAVPFLLISPDSRSGAMGDAGVAISPDANSIHWNPAKLVFIDPSKDVGFSMSYSPWLRALVNDINLAYLSGYKRIDRLSTIGASLRYFSLGNITFTDNFGTTIRDFKPNEFAFDVVYSRKLGDNFSAGLAARYVYSNLTGGTSVGGADTKPGQSAAADLSLYYISNSFNLVEKPSTIAFGTNISNIGAKMSYTEAATRDFIPTNFRLGTTLNMELDEFNKFSFSIDANKLLVPTNPYYHPTNGDIVSGRNPDVGVASGIFGSFTDAPGNVFEDNGSYYVESGSVLKEELNEINLSFGAEFLYSELFALRAGYFHEHPTKGNRRFISFGAGIKYKVLELDLSYILALTQASPLANTIRFSIKLNMGSSGSKN
ncbi:type IX secretion system outer membrane channel protein PorV [Bacteroidota bacterium]|jgi:hypothetical protein|nr:type IX secretion system outer membrane channel protein PorV [Bacteroidota bacterium]